MVSAGRFETVARVVLEALFAEDAFSGATGFEASERVVTRAVWLMGSSAFKTDVVAPRAGGALVLVLGGGFWEDIG
jgi:hypothetical protein